MDVFEQDRFKEAIDNALYAKADATLYIALMWKGGHVFNVYSLRDWRAIDCVAFGWGIDNPSVADVRFLMDEYIIRKKEAV